MDIFVINSDGAELINLTKDPSTDQFPSWSPADAIAFSSDRTGKDEIFVMNTDGSGLKQISQGVSRNYQPRWSPDGQWLAYHCSQDLNTHTCIQPADGSDHMVKIEGLNPVWSPTNVNEAMRIAFNCGTGGQMDICIAGPDGSNQVNLTNSQATEIDPYWSPDGRWIAYQSNQYQEISIYKLCIDCAENSVPIRLTGGPASGHWLSWSPDGTYIAYLLDEDLYVMRADGSGQKLLAGNVMELSVWPPKLEEKQ